SRCRLGICKSVWRRFAEALKRKRFCEASLIRRRQRQRRTAMNDQPSATPQPGASAGGGDGDKAAATAGLEGPGALRARADKGEQQRDELRDLAQRPRADFENYQKRLQRDLADERRYAAKPLAAELLPALDNLERATQAARQAGEKGPLVQG